MDPTIVVTGVSSGIGYDAVRYLSQHGYFVFGSVRSSEVKAELESEFPENFEALVFDVTDVPAIKNAAHRVAEHLGKRRLTAIVNNAGIAEGGPMQLLEDNRFRRQIEVNLIGTRNVTNAFLSHLGAELDPVAKRQGPPGKIINITSISGILNTPINGAYCVAKHAKESLGEVYRRELMQFGIDVVSIQPGPIQSRLWEKNVGSLDRFSNSPYKTMIRNTDKIMRMAQLEALPAETISRLIHRIICSPRPKLSYIVYKHKWRAWLLARILPTRLVDRLLCKRLRQTTSEDTGGELPS
jgi:NAD(P)-dependent dehydrogenase (short-subunit alcohol dehydrogenase family)